MIPRKVSTEEGQMFADKHHAIFFEVSAKANHNLDFLFTKIIHPTNEN